MAQTGSDTGPPPPAGSTPLSGGAPWAAAPPAGPPAAPAWRPVLRAVPGAVRAHLRERDLALTAGGLTFYAVLAAVPVVLVSGRLASLVVGQDTLRAFGDATDAALPDALGAGAVARGLIDAAASVGWVGVVAAAFPASLYGEGLRRAYASLGPGPQHERFLGWRGRVATLPVLGVAPALLVAVLAVTPLLARLYSGGVGSVALGVYVSLNVDWIAVSVPLAWTFRVVAPDHLPWSAAVVGGFTTGAFVSGFLQGFVLFLALPLDLGLPFGGLVAVGGAVAVVLWMWLLHAVVLLGYLATRTAVHLHASAGGAGAVRGPLPVAQVGAPRRRTP